MSSSSTWQALAAVRGSFSQSPAQWSWILLDAGSFGFATVTFGTLLPVFFKHLSDDALTPHQQTVAWGYAVSVVALCSALCSPVIGACADG